MNRSPVAGVCSVVPAVGEALSTLFNVECSTNFTDDEDLSYRVGYRRRSDGAVLWLESNAELPFPTGFTMLSGYEEQNYTVDVFVRASDRFAASVDITLQANVRDAWPMHYFSSVHNYLNMIVHVHVRILFRLVKHPLK